MTNVEQPMLWSIARLAERWDVSKEFVRKLIAHDELNTVRPGARRLVPWSEVQRAERFGLGKARKYARINRCS
jgi:excisionase family DNA binding protein